MTLPFSQEIREARARSERAQNAVIFDKHLETALTGLSIIQQQVLRGLEFQGELPGEDLLVEVPLRYPDIDIGPVPEGLSTLEAVHHRTLVFQQVRDVLAPWVAESLEVAAALHELQHQQHHELEKPEWAEVVEGLNVLARERDALAHQMAAVRERQAQVHPVTGLFEGIIPQLTIQVAATETEEDPDGIVAWRVARLAQKQLVGMANLLIQVDLVVPLPFEPMVPDTPHPRHRERLVAESIAVLKWMREVYDAFADQRRLLEEQLEARAARHTELEDAMKEQMG